MKCLFTQDDKSDSIVSSIIKDSWLLIDTGLTFNSVCNKELIQGVITFNPMYSVATRGSTVYHEQGFLKLLPEIEVYYNPKSVANILSLSYVSNTYQVTMDNDLEDAINVHLEDNKILKFVRCKKGLYYFDTKHEYKMGLLITLYY